MDEFPVNKEFPPDFKKYGSRHNGYKNDVQEQIFYDFATIGYDLEVHYNGKKYYFANDSKGVCQCKSRSRDLAARFMRMPTIW